MRIIVSRSILVRASTTVPSASCPAARRRNQRPAPSNPWNHLRAPAHHRLWDRRNGSMRSLRVKRRYCAVKGSVPAGRSRRSRLFPVFYRDEWRFEVEVTGLREAGRRRLARVKCSGALSNDRASDDHLGIKIAFDCCSKVSFDVPIASPSLAREETKARVEAKRKLVVPPSARRSTQPD